jgi:hypothetical protein
MYDRLRQDNARITNTGFSLAVVFTSPSGVEHNARCFFSDIGMMLSAEGFPIPGRRIAITTSTTDLLGAVVFTESNHPKEGWKINLTYNGTSFYGEVLDAMYDRTFGAITMNAGKIKVVA